MEWWYESGYSQAPRLLLSACVRGLTQVTGRRSQVEGHRSQAGFVSDLAGEAVDSRGGVFPPLAQVSFPSGSGALVGAQGSPLHPSRNSLVGFHERRSLGVWLGVMGGPAPPSRAGGQQAMWGVSPSQERLLRPILMGSSRYNRPLLGVFRPHGAGDGPRPPHPPTGPKLRRERHCKAKTGASGPARGRRGETRGQKPALSPALSCRDTHCGFHCTDTSGLQGAGAQGRRESGSAGGVGAGGGCALGVLCFLLASGSKEESVHI